jgi:hypothetical protein
MIVGSSHDSSARANRAPKVTPLECAHTAMAFPSASMATSGLPPPPDVNRPGPVQWSVAATYQAQYRLPSRANTVMALPAGSQAMAMKAEIAFSVTRSRTALQVPVAADSRAVCTTDVVAVSSVHQMAMALPAGSTATRAKAE